MLRRSGGGMLVLLLLLLLQQQQQHSCDATCRPHLHLLHCCKSSRGTRGRLLDRRQEKRWWWRATSWLSSSWARRDTARTCAWCRAKAEATGPLSRSSFNFKLICFFKVTKKIGKLLRKTNVVCLATWSDRPRTRSGCSRWFASALRPKLVSHSPNTKSWSKPFTQRLMLD